MDAIEYLKTRHRMCTADGTPTCEHCPLGRSNNGADLTCFAFQKQRPEEAVSVVEKWAAEHPAKTRQSEFVMLTNDTGSETNMNTTVTACAARTAEENTGWRRLSDGE